MGLCRCALDVAVLAVNVEVEASRFQAGVDDIDGENRKKMQKCISFAEGFMYNEAKFPQKTISGRGYSAIAPLLEHTENDSRWSSAEPNNLSASMAKKHHNHHLCI